MNDPIDYSRPVGWWCPVCGDTNHVSSIGADGRERQRFCIQSARTGFCFRRAIPRYLPIPEGQRPPAASEVEDAEVVTLNVSDLACYASGWRSTFTEAVDEINYIVTCMQQYEQHRTDSRMVQRARGFQINRAGASPRSSASPKSP